MNWFKNLKMLYKILLPVAVLLLISLASIEVVATYKSSAAIEAVAERELYGLAGTYGEKVLAYVAKAQNQAEGFAEAFGGLKEDNKNLSRESVIAMLKGFVAGNPEYVGACVGWEPDAFDGQDANYAGTSNHDASGRFVPYVYRDGGVIMVDPLVGYDVPGDGDYYLKPKEFGRTFITDPYVYNVGGKDISMVSICSPIMVNGVFKGVFCADLPITNIMDLVSNINPYETGYAWLMTPTGNFIYHPKSDFINKNIYDVASFQDEEALKKAIEAGDSYFELRKAAATGAMSMVQYVPVEFSGTGQRWYLAVSAPMDKILVSSKSLTNDLILIGVFAFIVVLIAIFFVARSISKPIGIMADAAKEVASGNMNVRLDDSLFGGELLDLNAALREMLVGLVENISKSEKMAQEAQEQTEKAKIALNEADEARSEAENAKREGMLQAAERLAGIVSQVSSATQELTAQIDESNRGSETQRERTSESATAMEQMNASVLEVARNAGDASESALEAKSKAEDGGKIVANVVTAISEVNKYSEEMVSGLDVLGGHADGISQVITVITDIADQTNLLALNAAIEAARAGEAGRGFAVVADEVRKLAEKTMQATQEVGQAVHSIQSETRRNIEKMGNAAEMVGSSTELAGRAGESLEEIVEIVETTAEQVRSIATASEEQSAASEQINRGIEEVNLIANDNAQAMRESAAAVEELMRLGEQLTGLIEELRNS
ncbi:methyl-accepting chemotaxis protein [Maridesulfovibrio salexigens]|uniref:Methyl-accepting chemotaxis sensory transducer with Cache sensor n=1 Tax=Maridesulfovibrio salexigens (strain ATCC 14822 / DSM 2638 / NCIMB 8403 / VKM B-1763) TaxID=526222 RepID=C6BZH4_MARSD|nr:methyl-accepting chemotaxis protein [Maridesulfovibrio salexigens]ACS80811.1 methyl-accepting chemotaxis sensory transducer with Cache sensor [Maridesulfovibrio salexigens DSM 2638]